MFSRGLRLPVRGVCPSSGSLGLLLGAAGRGVRERSQQFPRDRDGVCNRWWYSKADGLRWDSSGTAWVICWWRDLIKCETRKARVGNPKWFCIPVIHGDAHFPDHNDVLQGMWSEIWRFLGGWKSLVFVLEQHIPARCPSVLLFLL